MSWLIQLFNQDSVPHAILIISLVISTGLILGNLALAGIRLGIAGVLFSGLIFGHFDLTLNAEVMHFLREFGLILFVYAIGLQVGPSFVSAFFKQGLKLNMLAAAVVLGAFSVHAFRAQLGIWRDSETLFTHMESHPGFTANPRQQGHIYILWARFEATRHRPARAAELFNRAQDIYLRQIQLALQRADYAEALSYLSHEEHHFGLTPVLRREQGAWLLALGRVDEARAALRQAQAALPDDARVRQLLEQAEVAGSAAPSRPARP